MVISCKCLNVSLELGKTRPKGMPLSSLHLTSIEESHPFFSEGIAEVDTIVSITKHVASLTSSTTVDNWVIETCLNCCLPFFAKHKENNHLPLISAGLIADPNTVLSIKKHPDYSPVFRILIKPHSDGNAFAVKPPVEAIFSDLQQSLDAAIKRQVEKTDENIRQYSEQQFEILTKYQARAIRDHGLIVRNIQSVGSAADNPTQSTAMHTKSDAPSFSSALSSPERFSSSDGRTSSTKALPITIRPSAKRSNSLFSPREGAGLSCDVEGVFNLDDMEDSPSENVGDSDSDHDDSGSHDEGIDIPRKKENLNMARSLPVNVPAFGPRGLQLQPVEIPHDLTESEDPKDIAASIKALARSVHGDAVFGDLPRPRFSTQI